ncbi:MAG: HEAT repeat domain-containing protein [Deltaproteobacteria bacterium]|nr:HEAT repeat domain-containing protein [Deltaproteobacteria bacterium]
MGEPIHWKAGTVSPFVETIRVRRWAVSRLEPTDEHDLFVLRDALVLDESAEVRAAAILRLEHTSATRLLPYLRDATHDPSMQVREAAFVALARAGDRQSLARALDVCRSDRGFRVRRMALVFAARTCRADAIPVLAVASRDPFWRVRVAARRAGAMLDAAVDTDGVHREGTLSERQLGEIDDADPAVVVLRLTRARGSIELDTLVPLLGSAHLPLRRMAVVELATRADLRVLRAAASWLEDERIPYAPSAAEAVLARSGVRSEALAAAIVGEADPDAGALAWAVAATPCPLPWSRIERFCLHADARVRRATAARAPESAPNRSVLLGLMACLLEDPDDVTQLRAAGWLARTRSRDARSLLSRIDPSGRPSPVRKLLVGLRSEARDLDGLRDHARDPHAGIRAAALAALADLDAIHPAERRRLREDPDPWIRRSVLDAESVMVGTRDPSPWVRRSAIERLADRTDWALSVTSETEPEASLRAHAARILGGIPSDAATQRLLGLARDGDPGVRSVVAAALEQRRDSAHRLLGAGHLDGSARIAAHSLLRLAGAADATTEETDPRVLAHLALLDDVLEGRAPRLPETTSAVMAHTDATRQRLGRDGPSVRPFGISGAHGLTYDDFALARERGVDLFFWEPRHRELSRFLRASRSSGAAVVAGTYHADQASIERDVVRTLRALKIETIDVFLAFWTRSAARIDAVHGVLCSLRKRGLIRAAGISTHDRALACDAADRRLDVVMVRHSAAHRGAEWTVFPHCALRGVGVITFSNLCYGRMLHRTPALLSAPVTAPECYRYSLSQPGVGACVAAPRRRSELLEDLAVLDAPSMDPMRQSELRAHGDHVYAQSKAWSAETWSVAEQPRPRADHALDDWLDDWGAQPDLSPSSA